MMERPAEITTHPMLTTRTTGLFDKIGLVLSSICMVHCVLTPLVMLLLPFTLEMFDHDRFHEWVFWPILAVALVAFYRGYRTSRKPLILLLGTLGVSILASAHALGTWLGNETLEYGITIIGSALLVTAHLKNLRAINHHHHHKQRLKIVTAKIHSCPSCDHH